MKNYIIKPAGPGSRVRLSLVARLVPVAMLLGLVPGVATTGAAREPATTPTSRVSGAISDEPLAPVSTGFTYQGRLQFNNVPANDQYDLEFRLYDASAGGTQEGSTNTLLNQTVSDGLFTVTLNFGNNFLGEERWLQIAVRPAGGPTYTTLSPRQQITATPYAMSLRPGAVITGTTANPLLTLISNGTGGALTVRSTDPTYQALTVLSPANIAIAAEGGGVAAVYGHATANGVGVQGLGATGVAGESNTSGGAGVAGASTAVNATGVKGTANNGSATRGVWGESSAGDGLYGTSTSGRGVAGFSSSSYGMYGSSGTGIGVAGVTASGDDADAGVVGSSSATDATGVKGIANNGSVARGVWGESDAGYALYGNSVTGRGVGGFSTSDIGVWGSSSSDSGVYGSSSTGSGVAGQTSSSNDAVAGVVGSSSTTNATGVKGTANNGSVARGVWGESSAGDGLYGTSTSGRGVAGFSSSDYGMYGSSGTGIGVAGVTASGDDADAGVVGSSSALNATGVKGIASNGSGARGVWGYSASAAGSGTGVYGESTSPTNGTGVYGTSSSIAGGNGVYGEVTGAGGDGVKGVANFGSSATGVTGSSASGKGVYGFSPNGVGVHAYSSSGDAFVADTDSGYAGHFNGNVFIAGDLHVTGNCTGCLGPAGIDHPLDPAGKYLYHAAVQSHEMKNIYDGNVTTGADAEAIVTLPDWFEALNKDFRYQLTIVGEQFAQARVSSKIKNNQFTIKTDKPGIEVSWQVTGIRKDAYAQAHPVQVEVEKPLEEKGTYLYPVEQGQPATKEVDYERRHRLDQAKRESSPDIER